MNDQNNILTCDNISHSFKDGEVTIPVLQDINFHIKHGESVAIMGSSGAGKSTLLQLLGGLDKPDSGQVTLKGHTFSQMNIKKRGQLRNQYLGFVYQFHHLLPEFSSLENVMMPLLIGKVSRKKAQKLAEQMLQSVGLEHRVKHRPAQMSGGERQRTAIARALVTNPACVLADEPTGNLDETTASSIIELMLNLNKQQNSAMIIVTHDTSLANRMNKIYELSGHQLLLKKQTD